MGLQALRDEGFKPWVHPQVRKHHQFFAGTDKERADGFFDFACDPRFTIVWCARGGYGAARILPLLERLTAERGVPARKLLVGYSDATALADYVRKRWGWATLHAPMPGIRKFVVQTRPEWDSLISFVRTGRASGIPWEKCRLTFAGKAPEAEIRGSLIGGNLSVWTSLLGTPYAPSTRGKILFLEDVDEPLYRLDRMFQQLVLAGGLKGVKALVLGNFQSCDDSVSRVLASKPATLAERERMLRAPRPEELKPLRPKLETVRALRQIFGAPCQELGIPVAFGLPAGHGPGLAALPLGAEYILSPQGRLSLKNWDWVGPV
jgi:muramoyltetrapeptide carboxypeptidase